MPKEVFLSHSSQDQEFVSRLSEELRRSSVQTWYSKTNILGAQQWHDEIGSALKRCDWFIVVLSPNSVESIWVKRELVYALQQNRFENRIVPVLYQDCEYERLSWVLSSIQMVNFQGEFEMGFRELQSLWELNYPA